jgi:hypothetical protein
MPSPPSPSHPVSGETPSFSSSFPVPVQAAQNPPIFPSKQQLSTSNQAMIANDDQAKSQKPFSQETGEFSFSIEPSPKEKILPNAQAEKHENTTDKSASVSLQNDRFKGKNQSTGSLKVLEQLKLDPSATSSSPQLAPSSAQRSDVSVRPKERSALSSAAIKEISTATVTNSLGAPTVSSVSPHETCSPPSPAVALSPSKSAVAPSPTKSVAVPPTSSPDVAPSTSIRAVPSPSTQAAAPPTSSRAVSSPSTQAAATPTFSPDVVPPQATTPTTIAQTASIPACSVPPENTVSKSSALPNVTIAGKSPANSTSTVAVPKVALSVTSAVKNSGITVLNGNPSIASVQSTLANSLPQQQRLPVSPTARQTNASSVSVTSTASSFVQSKHTSTASVISDQKSKPINISTMSESDEAEDDSEDSDKEIDNHATDDVMEEDELDDQEDEEDDQDYLEEAQSSGSNPSEEEDSDDSLPKKRRRSALVKPTSRGRRLGLDDTIDPELYGLRRSGRSRQTSSRFVVNDAKFLNCVVKKLG